MKILKGFICIVMSIIMLLSLCGVLSSISIQRSTTPDVIKLALEKTDAVDSLTDEIESNIPVDLGDSYHDALERIVTSKAMKEYYAEYLDTAITCALDGEEIPAIDEEALQKAFMNGFEELGDNLGLSAMETYFFNLAKDEIVSRIASYTCSYLSQYTVEIKDAKTQRALSAAQFVNQEKFRYGSMLALALSAIIILIVFFKKGSWLLITGFVTLLGGGIFYILSGFVGSSAKAEASFDAIDRILMEMLHIGIGSIAVITLACGAVLFAAGMFYKILRLIF